MTYRTIANWQIEIGPIQEAKGWRSILGIGQFSEEFGIKFRDKETRFTVRTSDITSLYEIEHNLKQLAHARYSYHHQCGLGNASTMDPYDGAITSTLESFGVHLPSWLK